MSSIKSTPETAEQQQKEMAALADTIRQLLPQVSSMAFSCIREDGQQDVLFSGSVRGIITCTVALMALMQTQLNEQGVSNSQIDDVADGVIRDIQAHDNKRKLVEQVAEVMRKLDVNKPVLAIFPNEDNDLKLFFSGPVEALVAFDSVFNRFIAQIKTDVPPPPGAVFN